MMYNNALKLGTILAAIALLASLAVVAPVAAQSTSPYELNAILPLTGNLAFVGQQEQKAIAALATFTNAHGGIHGRPLHVVFMDDTNNPATAVQLGSGLLAGHPAAVIGGGTGATCRALAALFKTGPVLYCLTPAVTPERGGYMYSTSVGYDDTIFATMRYFAAKKYERFAFISTTDASGQAADVDVAEALRKPENRNVTIVDHEKMAIGDISAAAQVARMLNAKPDAIFALVTGNAVGLVLNALHDAGDTLPVATTIGNLTSGQMDAYRAFLPADYLIPAPPWGGSPDAVPAGPLHAAIKQYFDVLLAAGGKPYDIGSALAYDPALLVIHALQQTPANPTAAQVHAYLSGLRGFAGSSGIYNFVLSPQRGLSIGDCIIVRWDAAAQRYIAVSGPGGNALTAPRK
jgi:branched-chain amino acid transport system substrate-binding protein